MAINIKFQAKILNCELMDKIIFHFNQKNKNEFDIKIKDEILNLFPIISGYKNLEMSIGIFDNYLFENLKDLLTEKIDLKKIKFLELILDTLKNLFETELIYFEDLIVKDTKDKGKLFIKNFEEINGLEILDKIILMQYNENLINNVNILIKMMDYRNKQ